MHKGQSAINPEMCFRFTWQSSTDMARKTTEGKAMRLRVARARERAYEENVRPL